jgi:hypothetical protein
VYAGDLARQRGDPERCGREDAVNDGVGRGEDHNWGREGVWRRGV